jgi:tellurite resistance protein TerA
MTNQTLTRGQRGRLADLGLASQFSISLELQSPGINIDVTCFGLDAQRKLSDDRYMTFFNQPETPCGGVKQTAPTSFRFDLSRLPGSIDVLVIALAIDGNGVMSKLGNCRANFDSTLAFPFQGTYFTDERAVMLLELYRKDGQWRVNAVAQGFNGGLDALVKHFGGAVQAAPTQAASSPSSPPPASSQPASPPSSSAPPKVSLNKITLTKAKESHRISLDKTSDAPRKIIVKATWTDNGDGDDDNDDLDLRVGILLPNGQMKFIQAPDRSGSFDSAPYVRHLGDVTGVSASPGVSVATKIRQFFTPPATPTTPATATETVEVNPEISQRLGGPVALVFSVYSALANGDVAVSEMSPKMVMEYGNQIIECAFDFKQSVKSHKGVYTYVIGLIEINHDSIRLSPSGLTSTPGTEWTPWLTRNGDTVQVSMDGPAVFKGKLASKAASLNVNNPHRYVP